MSIMGMIPAHTPPAMSIQPASGYIEQWYARFKKKNPINNITLHKKKLGIAIFSDQQSGSFRLTSMKNFNIGSHSSA